MNYHQKKDPVEKSLWEGVLDVSQEGKTECFQLGRDVVSQRQDSETIIGVEDCLVLNVYAPLDEKDELLLSTSHKNHKPVPGKCITKKFFS